MSDKLPWPTTYRSSPIHPERQVAMIPIEQASAGYEAAKAILLLDKEGQWPIDDFDNDAYKRLIEAIFKLEDFVGEQRSR